MDCPRCKIKMEWVEIRYSPYPMGHWVCPECGLEISKK